MTTHLRAESISGLGWDEGGSDTDAGLVFSAAVWDLLGTNVFKKETWMNIRTKILILRFKQHMQSLFQLQQQLWTEILSPSVQPWGGSDSLVRLHPDWTTDPASVVALTAAL